MKTRRSFYSYNSYCSLCGFVQATGHKRTIFVFVSLTYRHSTSDNVHVPISEGLHICMPGNNINQLMCAE